MSRRSSHARATVLGALADGPATTSGLYDRVGYPALLRAGLIDYRAFRRVLGALEAEGLVHGETTDEDEGTVWRIGPPHETVR